jgi:hypothetical protein
MYKNSLYVESILAFLQSFQLSNMTTVKFDGLRLSKILPGKKEVFPNWATPVRAGVQLISAISHATHLSL